MRYHPSVSLQHLRALCLDAEKLSPLCHPCHPLKRVQTLCTSAFCHPVTLFCEKSQMAFLITDGARNNKRTYSFCLSQWLGQQARTLLTTFPNGRNYYGKASYCSSHRMKISVHCGGTKRQKGEFWQNYTVENFFAKQPSPFCEILAFDESIIFLCYNALRMTELRPEDGIFFQ